jgi:hypothetical protein
MLVSILEDSEWRLDLLNSRRIFYEAQLEAETILRQLAGQRRLEIEALLRLGARLTERVSATVLSILVSIERGTKLKRSADYSSVHQAARQAGMASLLRGFDEQIRNASAHDDFEVGDEAVVLGGRRGAIDRRADDELVDVVLAALESVAGIFAGLDCVLLELNHPAASDRLGDLDVESRVKIALAIAGTEPGRIRVTGTRIEVSARALASVSVRPLSVIAIMVPFLPDEFTSLRLHLKRQDATLAVEAPLRPFREFNASQGAAKESAFVELLARTVINGRRVLSDRHVRFLTVVQAHGYLDSALGAAEAPLLGLVALARRLKDRDLAASLQAFVAAKRAREGGPALSHTDRIALKRLATYIETPPGPVNDGGPQPPPTPPNAIAA